MRVEAAIDINDLPLPRGVHQPKRVVTQTYRIIRDTNLCKQIKTLHKNECQLCGSSIKLPSGDLYSEAHHIIPLGAPHNGGDTAGNILVVCPNHHAMLDYCAMPLEFSLLRTKPSHEISDLSISYHNEIYRSRWKSDSAELS